jgi:hypothetical protein
MPSTIAMMSSACLRGRFEEACERAAAAGLIVLVQQQQRDVGGQRKPHLVG